MAIKSNLDSANVPSREMETRLPSAGFPYLVDFPDFPETVVIKPYSFETESILLGNRKWHEKMGEVLKKVVRLPEGFHPLSLLQGDAFYIFACARALTYGETYAFSSICPECEFREDHRMKVPEQLPVHCWYRPTEAELGAKKGDWNSDDSVMARGGFLAVPEFFSLELPRIKDDLTLRFLTLDDERALGERYQQIEKMGAKDTTGRREISKVASHIVSINNTTGDAMEVENYVSKIVGEDMVALNDAIRDRDCGIVFHGSVTCESCGADYAHSIPLRKEFFRRGRG